MSVLTDLVLHLRIAGVLLLGVGIGHLLLPRALGWPTELQAVSLMTRQVSYVHTYFIGLMCALFGLAATVLTADLLAPDRMAAAVLVGGIAVWGSRLVAELWVFDPSLWRGRWLTVVGHVASTGLWTYQTAVFGWALWQHA